MQELIEHFTRISKKNKISLTYEIIRFNDLFGFYVTDHTDSTYAGGRVIFSAAVPHLAELSAYNPDKIKKVCEYNEMEFVQ